MLTSVIIIPQTVYNVNSKYASKVDIFVDMMDRIIAARQDADETQRELAKAIGVNHIQWAKYESRKNEPPVRYLLRVCEHYQISADYFLGLPPGLKWPRQLKKCKNFVELEGGE